MRILSLITLALLVQGCATVKTVRGPSGDEMTVEYSGSARGAERLVRADVRKDDAETTREVALEAAENGMPVSVSATDHGTKVSTGYTYGGYGAYGYGQVPPDVVTTYGGTAGYMSYGVPGGSGGLPVLSTSGTYISPTTPATAGTVTDVDCPSDPNAKRTLAEEIACQGESIDWLIDQEGSR